MAYNLKVFSFKNSPRRRKATALSFIKEVLKAIKNRGNIEVKNKILMN